MVVGSSQGYGKSDSARSYGTKPSSLTAPPQENPRSNQQGRGWACPDRLELRMGADSTTQTAAEGTVGDMQLQGLLSNWNENLLPFILFQQAKKQESLEDLIWNDG